MFEKRAGDVSSARPVEKLEIVVTCVFVTFSRFVNCAEFFTVVLDFGEKHCNDKCA